MARSDALKYFQKHKAAQVSQCCWLAYNLIIMTINVAGSWNFHLDIIKPSAGAGPNNAHPGLQLGHYRRHTNTAPAGLHSTLTMAILQQKKYVRKNWWAPKDC